MRVPIQYALLYPERVASSLPRLDLTAASPLTFGKPDLGRFPCLRLAREAGETSDGHAVVLNGADEAAVELFLAGQIGFMDIPRYIEMALEAYGGDQPGALEETLALDAWARGHVISAAHRR
jgi:1-deoxy-D-xylulose-5-phosphate reductoisomerase